MKISKEIRIGFVSLLSIGLIYWGINFLKGKNIFTYERVFYGIYEDSKGLVNSNKVVLNGNQIGFVSDIYFIPNDSLARLMVEFTITNDIEFPKNSKAELNQDLLGTAYVSIVRGNSKKIAQDKDTLLTTSSMSIQEEVNRQILPVKLKAEELLSSLDTLVETVQLVFNEENRQNLSKSFESITNTIKSLEKTSANLDYAIGSPEGKIAKILANIENITSDFAENGENINQIIENINSISDSLAAINLKNTIEHVEMALNDFSEVMEKVNQGEGNLGLLLKDDSLYNNLNSASKNLDELLEDMKLHPKRYVHFSIFGKSDRKQPYKKPEDKE